MLVWTLKLLRILADLKTKLWLLTNLLRGHSITTWKRWGGGSKNVCVCPCSGFKNCPRGGGGLENGKICPRSCWMTPKSILLNSLKTIGLFYNSWNVQVKFRYCEKTTKFGKISHLFLKLLSNVKTKWKIFSNFYAFSEYLDFKRKNRKQDKSRKQILFNPECFRDGTRSSPGIFFNFPHSYT